MASTVPVIRQVALLSIIPQLLFMGLNVYVFYLLAFQEPVLWGTVTCLIGVFLLRNLIAKSHRQAMRLVKKRQFVEAIPLFEKSVEYFTKNSWIDRYRFLTLLSSSKMTYKEMGLGNIAFCYSQTGNGQKAKEYYERTLQEFPDNGLAIAGLNMINSVGEVKRG